MYRNELILSVLLRLVGMFLLLAFLAVALPASWMASIHEWLGLGEFPEAAVTDYLARTISFLYGMHGGLLVLLSSDVRKYLKIVRYVAALQAGFGAVVTLIDLHAGMPLYWTLVEGPPTLATGLAMLWLAASIRE